MDLIDAVPNQGVEIRRSAVKADFDDQKSYRSIRSKLDMKNK